MQIHKSFHQSQSQSGARMLHIYLIEVLKYMMYMFFRHAYTRISDLHTDASLIVLLYP